jgi:erythromycin esterase-like protein
MALAAAQAMEHDAIVDTVRAAARPLDAPDAAAALLPMVGNARFVLLGEASHGTREFYTLRAAITLRLVDEIGFDAVAIEGDWPDAERVHRFLRGRGSDATARAALAGFRRFPTWMWRNTDVLAFVEALRGRGVGFYGLDLYSLHASMAAVLEYLARTDEAAAARARERYACFDRFGDDSQRYGLLAGLGAQPSCESEVVAMLTELQSRAAADDDGFGAEQNARLVRNAESYYRAMVTSDESSWNLRDGHMAETLWALERHLGRRNGRPPKIVVWAHNSHLGDARATEMGARGELNLGQLVRQRHGAAALLVGFTTDHGRVMAASEWDGPHERKRVLPARADSYEGLLHQTGLASFLLPLRDAPAAQAALQAPRLERAIGVIYRPETERQSHYFRACLPRQFDAVIHVDATNAVQPLDRREPASEAEAPETYPSGV